MSLDIRSQQRFNNFLRAFARYEEAVQISTTLLEQEGLIQRFEYTFELAWKSLQDLLQERGYLNIRGPRPVIEQAFQDGIISEGTIWLSMLKARNEIAHIYDEGVFNAIIKQLKGDFLSALLSFKHNFPTQSKK